MRISLKAGAAALALGAALAGWAAHDAAPARAGDAAPGAGPAGPYGTAPSDHALDRQAWASYVAATRDALGEFADIPLYKKTEVEWIKLSGHYLPITVNGKTPETYAPGMKGDRPMVLPTTFEGWGDPEGQAIPYGVVGRMPGSNPEVQWVFLARHYKVKDPKDVTPAPGQEAFDELRDVAVIGHHPRTGATSFFQFYDPEQPKPVPTIIAPFSDGGEDFWNAIPWMADIDCAQCHAADPFIHTPWITQAKLEGGPESAAPESVVPSNPLGPFNYVPAVVTENGTQRNLLGAWDRRLVQMDDPGNQCTTCHRIPVSDPLGMVGNSAHGAGNPTFTAYYYQTQEFEALPWMPPVNAIYGDFYAGQSADMTDWLGWYGEDARKAIAFAGQTAGAPKGVANPAPPEGMRAIMIPRDGRDTLAPGAGLLVADARMRANTDAKLEAWRFVAAGDAAPGAVAAPAILRPVPDPLGGTTKYEVIHVGAPRGAAEAGEWLPLDEDGGPVEASVGDVLAVILANDGDAAGAALTPFSADDWASSPASGPGLGVPENLMTFRLNLTAPPAVGEVVTVGDPAYRTYSFEYRAAIGG